MVKLYKEKNRTGETCSARERDMEVFSNDFAAVYFREKLCYDVLTEYGTISEGFRKTFIGDPFVAFARENNRIQRVHAP